MKKTSPRVESKKNASKQEKMQHQYYARLKIKSKPIICVCVCVGGGAEQDYFHKVPVTLTIFSDSLTNQMVLLPELHDRSYFVSRQNIGTSTTLNADTLHSPDL